MSKAAKKKRSTNGSAGYKASLRELQIELVKVQKHIIKHGHKVLVIVEGRDAGGKDGTIKRIVQHLSPRETRVVALGKPSDKDRVSWYFQRYATYLPAAQEMVLFNRSWYNRAGVERVMGFCTDAEYESFLSGVVPFEHMSDRRRHSDHEVLPRHQQEGAEEAAARSARESFDAMEDQPDR